MEPSNYPWGPPHGNDDDSHNTPRRAGNNDNAANPHGDKEWDTTNDTNGTPHDPSTGENQEHPAEYNDPPRDPDTDPVIHEEGHHDSRDVIGVGPIPTTPPPSTTPPTHTTENFFTLDEPGEPHDFVGGGYTLPATPPTPDPVPPTVHGRKAVSMKAAFVWAWGKYKAHWPVWVIWSAIAGLSGGLASACSGIMSTSTDDTAIRWASLGVILGGLISIVASFVLIATAGYAAYSPTVRVRDSVFAPKFWPIAGTDILISLCMSIAAMALMVPGWLLLSDIGVVAAAGVAIMLSLFAAPLYGLIPYAITLRTHRSWWQHVTDGFFAGCANYWRILGCILLVTFGTIFGVLITIGVGAIPAMVILMPWLQLVWSYVVNVSNGVEVVPPKP